GLDNEKSVGIGGTIVRDKVAPKTVLKLALIFFAVAILLGVYICIASSWWIAVIGLICMIFGYLYTGGPFPIAYTPFGELCSGFLMGTVIIGISYYIQTLTLTVDVVLISIPIAIFIGAIMLSNNIRDLDGDKLNGRKTVAILIGRQNAIVLLASMFTIAYCLTAYFIIIGMLPLWSLITFLSLTMVAAQVMGNDATIGFAASQGNFELNVFKPVIAYNFLQSCQLLADSMLSFDARCVQGIEPNHEKIEAYLKDSLMLVTALNPHIGYENAAKIAKKAFADDTTLKEAAVELGLLTADEFDQY